MKTSRNILKGKQVLLGVTGGIAAYKTPWLVRELKRAGADVHVVMTPAAREFVTATTLSTVSDREVVIDTFPPQSAATIDLSTWHIHLARSVDLMLIAPATSNTIAKVANGFADNAVTTLVLALRCPLIIVPSMDEEMWKHPATQMNIVRLRDRGCFVMPPESGELASGVVGEGRMPEIDKIVGYVEAVVAKTYQDLKGKRILVSAGPTYEPIDPVRYVGNRSSGKMGFATANAAALRGAEVTLVSGPSSLVTPSDVRRLDVETAAQMYETVLDHSKKAHAIIMAAAVADYAPVNPSTQKIKKADAELTLRLSPTKDILETLGSRKNRKVLVGFALETKNEIQNAKEKLRKKRLDLIVLNNPAKPGAAFGGDTNIATLIGKNGKQEHLPLMAKFDLANAILDRVAKLLKK